MGYTRIEYFADKILTFEYDSELLPKEKRRISSYKRNNRRKQVKVYKSPYAMHRAKTAFFKLVSCNLHAKGKPALCTFTVYEKDLRFSDIYSFITQWKRRVERKTHTQISYIAVPERGSATFRVHVHALVWGLTEKQIREERSTRNLQRCYAKGFLDVRGAYDNSPKLASYLAKYLTKQGQIVDYGERGYTNGGHIERPRNIKANNLLDTADWLIPDKNTLVKVEQYDTKYFGRCVLSTYKL